MREHHMTDYTGTTYRMPHHWVIAEGLVAGDILVDSRFVQAAVSRFGGEHLGWGDFAVTMEDGLQVTFIRDERVPVGFVGRSHRLNPPEAGPALAQALDSECLNPSAVDMTSAEEGA